MIIMVIVVEIIFILEIPLILQMNHQVNLATTQGESEKGQLVRHNITLYKPGESSRSILTSQRVWSKDHPFDMILDDPNVEVKTRSAVINQYNYSRFLSGKKPKGIEEALNDHDWVTAMQKESKLIVS
jgi:hypothetical protein